MKVAVTGGAGLIGASLCQTLGSTPGIDEVVAFDQSFTGVAENLDLAPHSGRIEGDT